AAWATDLRKTQSPQLFTGSDDPAFAGSYTLLNTDQGIRGFLSVVNDVIYVQAGSLSLDKWATPKRAAATDEEEVSLQLQTAAQQPFHKILVDLSRCLASYDWRTSSAPNLNDGERRRQGVYRGSSGYKELRRDLLQH